MILLKTKHALTRVIPFSFLSQQNDLVEADTLRASAGHKRKHKGLFSTGSVSVCLQQAPLFKASCSTKAVWGQRDTRAVRYLYTEKMAPFFSCACGCQRARRSKRDCGKAPDDGVIMSGSLRQTRSLKRGICGQKVLSTDCCFQSVAWSVETNVLDSSTGMYMLSPCLCIFTACLWT